MITCLSELHRPFVSRSLSATEQRLRSTPRKYMISFYLMILNRWPRIEISSMRPRGVVVLGHSDPCHDLYYDFFQHAGPPGSYPPWLVWICWVGYELPYRASSIDYGRQWAKSSRMYDFLTWRWDAFLSMLLVASWTLGSCRNRKCFYFLWLNWLEFCFA